MRKETYIYFSIAMGLLVVSLAAYAFWFVILMQARTQANTAAASVSRIEKEDAQIAAAKGTLASLTADEVAVRAYFLSPEDIVGFLESLQNTGKQFGSAIEVASVSPNTDGRIALALHISGTFEAVMRTIGALEFGPHDIRLSLLTLDTAGSGSSWEAAATFSVGALASSTTP